MSRMVVPIGGLKVARRVEVELNMLSLGPRAANPVKLMSTATAKTVRKSAYETSNQLIDVLIYSRLPIDEVSGTWYDQRQE